MASRSHLIQSIYPPPIPFGSPNLFSLPTTWSFRTSVKILLSYLLTHCHPFPTMSSQHSLRPASLVLCTDPVQADISDVDTTTLLSPTNTLVVKLLQGKPMTRTQLKAAVIHAWGRHSELNLTFHSDNIFLYTFSDPFGLSLVLENTPWSFDTNLAIIQPWNPTIPAAHLGLSHATFWIQLHHLPPGCLTSQLVPNSLVGLLLQYGWFFPLPRSLQTVWRVNFCVC